MISGSDGQDKLVDVLLTVETHQRLTESIVDLLAMPEDDDIEFEAPALPDQLFNAADLS